MVRLELLDYRVTIEENLPQFQNCQVEFLAEGGNNVAVLVNRELVFLFPKNERYERKLRMQLKLLPRLASTLPVPIPVFQYNCERPTGTYPYTFAGYKLIQGTAVVECSQEVWEAEWWLRPFGGFVTVLHSFPIEEAVSLGVPGFSMQGWRESYYEWWQTAVTTDVLSIVPNDESEMINRYFEEYLNDDDHFEFEGVLLHNDLHLAHMFVDVDKKQLCGVIDFGDCQIGDPAIDVRNAWEPYYTGKRGRKWHERRYFYYRLIPLINIIIAVGNRNETELNDSLAEFRRKWAEPVMGLRND